LFGGLGTLQLQEVVRAAQDKGEPLTRYRVETVSLENVDRMATVDLRATVALFAGLVIDIVGGVVSATAGTTPMFE
jgi:hypothetical protein